MSLDKPLESKCAKFYSPSLKKDGESSLGSLSHHVNISLESSIISADNPLLTVGGNQPIYLFTVPFVGGRSWQFTLDLQQSHLWPPSLHLVLTHLHLCRNGTKLLSTFSCPSSPSHSRDVWYHLTHTPLLLWPVPKVGVPMQNYSTVFHSASLHCVQTVPSPSLQGIALLSSKTLLGKEEYWLVGGNKICSSSRKLYRSRKGYLAGKTKYRAKLSIQRCDSNSWAYICGNNRLYSNKVK